MWMMLSDFLNGHGVIQERLRWRHAWVVALQQILVDLRGDYP
jgi:hypothetical protein